MHVGPIALLRNRGPVGAVDVAGFIPGARGPSLPPKNTNFEPSMAVLLMKDSFKKTQHFDVIRCKHSIRSPETKGCDFYLSQQL